MAEYTNGVSMFGNVPADRSEVQPDVTTGRIVLIDTDKLPAAHIFTRYFNEGFVPVAKTVDEGVATYAFCSLTTGDYINKTITSAEAIEKGENIVTLVVSVTAGSDTYPLAIDEDVFTPVEEG